MNGHHPGNGDFTLYATLWFVQNGGFDLSRFAAVSDWMARMAEFGHGERHDISAEEALLEAAEALPAALPSIAFDPDEATDLRSGQTVTVSPEQLGHGTSVTGALVSLLPGRLTLRLHTTRCGEVHVHFPRAGYRVTAA